MYNKNSITNKNRSRFQKTIYDYYSKNGRKDLPWRKTKDPYYILVSEIMLQQTQVDRGIEKYLEFIEAFPTMESLAKAKLQKVLKVWQGLGYNRRAIQLQKCAQTLANEYNSKFPHTIEELIKLPGIGPYTAPAILAFAFNLPNVFIETNIRTVYIHYFFPGRNNVSDKDLIPIIEKTMDTKNPRKWYNALMDYGVMLKKQYPNPSRNSSHYVRQSSFKGSNREIRGKLLKILVDSKDLTEAQVLKELKDFDTEKIRKNIDQMQQEGFLIKKRKRIMIV